VARSPDHIGCIFTKLSLCIVRQSSLKSAAVCDVFVVGFPSEQRAKRIQLRCQPKDSVVGTTFFAASLFSLLDVEASPRNEPLERRSIEAGS
jgi:hypothetical protein